VKRDRIAALGAKIVEEGTADLSIAGHQALAYSRTQGAYFLNDATDPDLPAGPATIALEIFEQLPSVDTIVVPVGDTALIRGVGACAKSLSQTVRVIGVQAEQAPSYFLSWKQGRASSTETCNTIADGLATRIPEPDNVRAIRDLVDDIVLVTEDEMLAAIYHLALQEHIIAEPAGAAATAALLHEKFQCRRNTVLLVTGANITPEVLRTAICSQLNDIQPKEELHE
jgi:threonine dehydratase